MIHADTPITHMPTFALAQLLTAEWEVIHPPKCNCERCEWMLSLAFKHAFKAYYANHQGYEVVDLMEPQPETEGKA